MGQVATQSQGHLCVGHVLEKPESVAQALNMGPALKPRPPEDRPEAVP